MKTRWQELSLSEKRTILIGAILSSLLLIYCFIWLPLNQKIIDTRVALVHTQTLLSFMQAADSQLKTAQKKPDVISGTSGSSLASLIQNSLNSHSLTNSQFHAIDVNTVQLSFKQVGFDTLINWLLSLDQQSIEVMHMTVKTTNHEGLVETEFTLKRSN